MINTSVIVYNKGLQDALNSIIGMGFPFDAPIIHLYSNALAPGYGTVLADLVECAFAGYAPVTLGHWNSAVALGDSIHVYATQTSFAQFTYTGVTTSGNIYGAYGVSVLGDLLWVDYPLSPPAVLLPTQSFFYTPTLYAKSEY